MSALISLGFSEQFDGVGLLLSDQRFRKLSLGLGVSKPEGLEEFLSLLGTDSVVRSLFGPRGFWGCCASHC